VIVDEVEVAKSHHRLYLGPDARHRPFRGEIVPAIVIFDLAERPVAIAALPGGGERILVDVGCQKVDFPVVDVGEQLPHQDRKGVGLLARRAAGAPDAQALLLAASAPDDLGQDLVSQRVELSAVAEEVGFPDGEPADESAQFTAAVLLALEKCEVRTQPGEASKSAKAVLENRLKILALVLLEEEPRLADNEIPHGLVFGLRLTDHRVHHSSPPERRVIVVDSPVPSKKNLNMAATLSNREHTKCRQPPIDGVHHRR
jgi:hypothetical protein